jgi:lipopolysaccharide biosynthesis protein
VTWTRRLVGRTLAPAPEPTFLSVDGTLPPSPKVALWVHWEPSGHVSRADLGMLRHLRHLNYAVVAVMNRDDGGDPTVTQALAGVADVILQRPNVGYDFAGFRDGLLWVRTQLAVGAELLLLNNSTYGPFGSLAPLLAEADRARGDVWALTGSLEVEPHVQSYLLVVHPKAVAAPGFWAHWSQVKPPREKMRVVYECEIPLGVKLHNQGLRVRAVRSYHDLARRALRSQSIIGAYADSPEYDTVLRALRRGKPLNPTHHLWRWMLDSGVPLVKKDLLRINPPRLPDVADWADLVEGDSDVRAAVAADLQTYPGPEASSSK